LNLTVCPFCSCGCRMAPRKSAEDELVGLVPLRNHPISLGSLCIRGWNSHEYMKHSDRLDAPLLKNKGKQVRGSWEEAVGEASEGLRRVIGEWGPESVGFIGSTHCSNEDNYLLMRLARDVVKTGNIDTNNRLTYHPVLDALYDGLGTGTSTSTLKEVAEADFILVAGADLSVSCPQVVSRVFEAVVDPRATGLAKAATYHLKPDPGADLYWINGMISHLIEEGKVDAEFISVRTTGYNEFRKGFAGSSPPVAETMSGVPSGQLMRVAERLAEAERAVMIIGSGLTNTEDIQGTAGALINLGLITGHVGKKGSGILVVGGNNNTQGAWDMGVVPDRLPGGAPIHGITQERPARPGGDWKALAGRDYPAILEGVLSGGIHALYVMGEDPLAFSPAREELSEALAKLDLLVVQDLFPTELTRSGSVVFPSAAPFERGGTLTNLEGRVQRFDPILEVRGDTRPDWAILSEVCRAMGTDFGFKDVFEVTDEIASAVPSYEGITSAGLNEAMKGITRVPGEGEEGRKPWFREGWKGKFIAAPPSNGDRTERSEEYPLLLIPGRLPSFWGTGTRSSRINFLAREEGRSVIHLNPEDAERSGIRDGSRGRVIFASGTLETSVTVTEDMPRGLAYLPLHRIDGELPQISKRSLPIRIESC
jgi:predicted molibdopterin-dependent oxidoreductase YjgC